MGIIQGIVNFIKNIVKGSKNRDDDHHYTYESVGKTLEQFTSLVKATFGADYEIVENYSPANINEEYVEARAYNMAFFKEGRLVLTILFTEHNGDRNKYFINAKKACEENGITCLNFYKHFPNEDNYVINRIAESL